MDSTYSAEDDYHANKMLKLKLKSKVHVIEGAENTDLSAEAIRVVRLMNYWIPAKLQGTDVASYNTVSIGF